MIVEISLGTILSENQKNMWSERNIWHLLKVEIIAKLEKVARGFV